MKVSKGVVCHGICRATGEVTSEEIQSIYYEPGTTLDVTLTGRENHRRTVRVKVVNTFQNHILVRIDTKTLGSYNMSLNKVDVRTNEIKIREVS